MTPTAGTSVTSSQALFNQTDNPSTRGDEGQIDGIAAEEVRTGSYNRSGTRASSDGSAGGGQRVGACGVSTEIREHSEGHSSVLRPK